MGCLLPWPLDAEQEMVVREMDLEGWGGWNKRKMYEVMLYEEEMKKQELKSLLPRWTHACFLEELVSNLMFSKQTAKHLPMLKDMDSSMFASSVRSMQSFLLYGLMHQRFPVILLVRQEKTNISNLMNHPESANSD